MKWLIYGGNGWIGGMVADLLRKGGDDVIVGSVRGDDADGVRKEINEVSPDRVISTLGRTHGEGIPTIDYLEKPGKLVENVRDNLFAPINIANACREKGIHFTYLGTGCIFDYEGDFNKEFTEESLPNFFGSSYSIVKGFTDRLMHQYTNVLNVRIRMPITKERNPRDFITKILGYKKICSIPNSMTVLDELIPVMIDMARKEETGTINLCNPGVIEHNTILQMYKEKVDQTKEWENMSIDEQNTILASKRSNNHLTSEKLLSKYQVDDIDTAIRKIFEK